MGIMTFNTVLLATVLSLVSADFICPDGVVTCAEGKACCFQSGTGYSCCDKPDDMKGLTAGVRSMGHLFSNKSQEIKHAPSTSPLDYCPYEFGMKYCCSSETNCYAHSECCNADRCCMSGYGCCGDGEWCCMKGYRCGPYFNTCRSGVGTQAAQGVAIIVAVALASIKFARF